MSSRRLRVRLAALCALVPLLVACSAGDNGGVVNGPVQPHGTLAPAGQLHGRLPAAVAGRGVLRVGALIGRTPLLFSAPGATQLQGAEFDVLTALGRQLGVSVQVVPASAAQLAPQLTSGNVDAIIGGIPDVKVLERLGIDFVDYLTGRTAMLVGVSNPLRLRGPDDLCGHTVGVVANSAAQLAEAEVASRCSDRKLPLPRPSAAADIAGALVLLDTHRVDAVLEDAVVAQYAAQESVSPDLIEVSGAAIAPVPYGLGVMHTNPQLTGVLQAALRAIIDDGEYDQALARWGADQAALRTATVNGAIS